LAGSGNNEAGLNWVTKSLQELVLPTYTELAEKHTLTKAIVFLALRSFQALKIVIKTNILLAPTLSLQANI
jgi:hypothetical protein